MTTDTEKLKALIRTEPTLAGTLAEVERDYQIAKSRFDALDAKRTELTGQLKEIEQAKRKLAESAKPKRESRPSPAAGSQTQTERTQA